MGQTNDFFYQPQAIRKITNGQIKSNLIFNSDSETPECLPDESWNKMKHPELTNHTFYAVCTLAPEINKISILFFLTPKSSIFCESEINVFIK